VRPIGLPAEGVITVVVLDSQDAAIVELNAETDFVARSEDFKSFARDLAEQVARGKGHSVETVLTQDSLAEPGKTVAGAAWKTSIPSCGRRSSLSGSSSSRPTRMVSWRATYTSPRTTRSAYWSSLRLPMPKPRRARPR